MAKILSGSKGIRMQTWTAAVPLFKTGYHLELQTQVGTLRRTCTVYPAANQVFRAFELTAFDQVRVVLLGQDPYHGPGQAHGLAFSVPDGVRTPPSLSNVFKEIQRDIYNDAPQVFATDLSRWARQGVLLLNATLSVEAGVPGSHKGLGWAVLTDQVIKILSDQHKGLVFMLWGAPARAKASLVDVEKHLLLEAPHPSPLAAYRGFFGCRHFSQANRYLRASGSEPIVW
jgi:uracil-DNA glycosylase